MDMEFTIPPDKPPDPYQNIKLKQQLNFEIDHRKHLINTSPGPKFLTIKHIDPMKTLTKVSPFLIKKVIDTVAEGEIEICKKLLNGSILIKTKTHRQAAKIIQITSFNQEIKITVNEHERLNTTKGVIYSNELRGISEQEICDELKVQNVINVKKIKTLKNNTLTETGLHILTFNTVILPQHIEIGYEKTRVQPYIPQPLRCRNCLHFGHLTQKCKKQRTCANCGENSHINDNERNQICDRASKCTNCTNSHNALDKNCPIFIKQKEIQAIITIQKVDRKSANKIYNERQPNINNTSYAIITRTSKPTKNTEQHPTTHINNKPQKQEENPLKSPIQQSIQTETKQTPSTSVLTQQTQSPENKIYQEQKIQKPQHNAEQTNCTKIKILPKNTSKKNKTITNKEKQTKFKKPIQINLKRTE